MARRQVLLEIEDGGATLSVIEGHRGGGRVLACRRARFSGLTEDAIVSALRGMLDDLTVDSVHVALGDRRFQHFRVTVPRVGGADLAELAAREARRIGSMAPDMEVLTGLRYLRKTSPGIYEFAVVALPAHVWFPVRDACERLNLTVASLTSMEDAMAAVTAARPGVCHAVLDFTAGRARLVACKDGVVSSVRRFLIPGGQESLQDHSFLATQLALEIPRTLEYLEETTGETPSDLLVSHSLSFATDDLDMMAGGFQRKRSYVPELTALDEELPGMAACGLWQRLLRNGGFSILGSIHPRYPMGRAVGLAMGVLLCATGLALAFALDYEGVSRELDARAQAIGSRLLVLEAEEGTLSAALVPAEVDPVTERAAGLALRRRPMSLAISQVLRRAPSGISIQEIELAGEDGVVIVGQAEGEDRVTCLDRLQEFSARLREIPYMASRGEQVQRSSAEHRVGFRLRLLWRKP